MESQYSRDMSHMRTPLVTFYIPIRTKAVGSEAFWKVGSVSNFCRSFYEKNSWTLIMKQTTKHICSLYTKTCKTLVEGNLGSSAAVGSCC